MSCDTEEIKDDELITVPLGFSLGDRFETFQEFQTKLAKAAREKLLRFWRRDSRTIDGARKKTKRYLKSELEFYQLRYACFYAQKPRIKPTLGKRKRKPLIGPREIPCPALICLKVTGDGKALEVCQLVEEHNHPVNEEEYSKIRPKKKADLHSLFQDMDGNIILENANHKEDIYKMVLKKCRHIARIASISSPERVQDIMKNLNDYVFYLKYITPKEEIDQIDDESVEIPENNFHEILDEANESIKIIVEADAPDS